MAIFEVKIEKNKDLIQLYRKLNYISDCCSTRYDLLYGANVSVLQAYEEMEAVKIAFHQEEEMAYKHMVLSFETDEKINLLDLKMIGIKVCELIGSSYGDYQVLMAVHLNTDNLHIHYVANITDFLNGKRFNLTKQRLYDMKCEIDKILAEYNLNLIRMREQSN